MNTREMLEKYVRSFRLECHFLLDAVTTVTSMPIDIYNKASNNAKEELIEELKLSDEEVAKIEAIHRTFTNKVLEIENYNEAESYILEVIKKL